MAVELTYKSYIDRKIPRDDPTGHEPGDLPDMLFEFQRDIVRWAIRRGRACIFADCGLGKTPMQLAWAQDVIMNYGGNALILAPLAVASQTVHEGEKFGIDVNHCRSRDDIQDGINITNYEMLHKFNPSEFSAIVLDESSILKSYTGKFRNTIIEEFQSTPYRLACTATPAPNDYMELGNHAEFVGVMSREEMLAMYFVHDGGQTSKWRIKGHAETSFWEWMSSWAVVIRKPSDLGYDDAGFSLPEIRFHDIVIKSIDAPDGMLFSLPAQTLTERRLARKSSLSDRVQKCADIANGSDGPCLVWCDFNAESEQLGNAIIGAVEISGSDSQEFKETHMIGFSDGDFRVLVTKPSIAGFGMNWQHCNTMIFAGLSDSYEKFYQAVRRCWRFGQKNPVDVYLVTGEMEQSTVENVKRKERDADRMFTEMVEFTKEITSMNVRGTKRKMESYETAKKTGDGWTLHLGDCVEVVSDMDAESVDFSIFSPPFASLYTYSDSKRDMGNCKNYDEFADHFLYLVKELFRVTKPGRNLSFHCMNLPISKSREGFIGIRDFRGELIRMFCDEGWIYHSEVTIWKDPVVAMQRTKALGLLYKQLKKDSCMSRQGIADYLVTMRKPGDNPEPVTHTPDDFNLDQWQKYASPVWMDINPSDTLQHRSAREEKDERHICPLQLEVIRRALQLWSKPGDLVLSPFAGIGSEGYESIKSGRMFVGVELKKSYYNQAAKNMEIAVNEFTASDLFKVEA